MLNSRKITKVIYLVSSLFLIYSSYSYWIEKDYWQLFINFEFFVMIIYMSFFYPKNPLKLTQVSLLFLLIHFIGYGIHGIITNQVWHIVISVIYIIGYSVYTLRSKRKKYPIYFNSKKL